MVKILGIVDIFAALALFSILGSVSHVGAFILLSILLFLKASICFFDIGGIVDIFVAILILLSFLFILPSFIMIIGGIIIGIKGLVSLVS
jgi:hypothetical protein